MRGANPSSDDAQHRARARVAGQVVQPVVAPRDASDPAARRRCWRAPPRPPVRSRLVVVGRHVARAARSDAGPAASARRRTRSPSSASRCRRALDHGAIMFSVSRVRQRSSASDARAGLPRLHRRDGLANFGNAARRIRRRAVSRGAMENATRSSAEAASGTLDRRPAPPLRAGRIDSVSTRMMNDRPGAAAATGIVRGKRRRRAVRFGPAAAAPPPRPSSAQGRDRADLAADAHGHIRGRFSSATGLPSAVMAVKSIVRAAARRPGAAARRAQRRASKTITKPKPRRGAATKLKPVSCGKA